MATKSEERRQRAVIDRIVQRHEKNPIEGFQDFLDELVCDCFAERAASLNNRGPTDQSEYLLGELGVAYLYEQVHSFSRQRPS